MGKYVHEHTRKNLGSKFCTLRGIGKICIRLLVTQALTLLIIQFPATVYFRVVKHNTLSLLQSKQRNKRENLYEL